MPETRSRPLRRLAPALAVSLTLVAGGLTAAAGAHQPKIGAEAAGWLAGQLTGSGTITTVFQRAGVDEVYRVTTAYDETVDTALALLTAGGHDEALGRALTTLADEGSVQSYTQGTRFRPPGSFAEPSAKLAYLVGATGGDPTRVGGADLLSRVRAAVAADRSQRDRGQFNGTFKTTTGISFGVLALRVVGQSTDAAAAALLAEQCSDGSFPTVLGASTSTECVGTVHGTGLALQALAAAGRASTDGPTLRALDWLQAQQRPDGSFASSSPVRDTGAAAAGLAALGRPSDAAADWLAQRQNSDKGLPGAPAPDGASDVRATSWATPGLLGVPYPARPRVVRPVAIVCAPAVAFPTSTITAGQSTHVVLSATSGSEVTYRTQRLSNGDFTGTSGLLTLARSGQAVLPLTPEVNTRVVLTQGRCTGTATGDVRVRTNVTLAVERTDRRTYTFSGRALPGYDNPVVSVFRIGRDGQAVLVARTTSTRGAWSLSKTFTGSGRHSFFAVAAATPNNEVGKSTTRSVLIY